MNIEQVEIREILLKKFMEVKKVNPQYSLRSFANKIGVGSGALSQIINGKRKISFELAKRIECNLNLDCNEKERFFSYFDLNKKLNEDIKYSIVQDDVFNKNEFWIVYALLNLVNIPGVEFDVENLSRVLNVERELISGVIQKLFLNNFLFVSEDGHIERSKKNLTTTDNRPSEWIRDIHRVNLDLAKKSLDNVEMEFRDFTSITMPINLKKIELAKNLIRQFQDDFSKVMESDNGDEVYRLSMCFFPLSNASAKRIIK